MAQLQLCKKPDKLGNYDNEKKSNVLGNYRIVVVRFIEQKAQ
jgi:hypothetical protein